MGPRVSTSTPFGAAGASALAGASSSEAVVATGGGGGVGSWANSQTAEAASATPPRANAVACHRHRLSGLGSIEGRSFNALTWKTGGDIVHCSHLLR